MTIAMTYTVVPTGLDRATRIFGWLASGGGAVLLLAGGYMLLTNMGVVAENALFYLLGEIYAPMFLGCYALFVVWTGVALQRLRHWAPETSAIWPVIGMALVIIPGVSAFGGWFNFQSLLKAAEFPTPERARRWSSVATLWAASHGAAFVVAVYAIISSGMLERYTDEFGATMNFAQIGILASILCGIALIQKISSMPLRQTRDQALAATFT